MDSSSNSSDFQPPTGNPQNNVGGGLQPNSSLPQPIESTNQPGQPNPQALPRKDDLKVVTATNGTQLTPNTPPQGQIGPWVWLPAIIGLVIAIMIFKREKKVPAKKSISISKPVPKSPSSVLKDKTISSSKTKKKSKKKTKHKRR